MKQAPPTRRELEFLLDGTDEELDLTELMAGPYGAPLGLVETGLEGEDLSGVADLLAEFDAELAAREAAETAAAPVADVLPLGNRIVAGVQSAVLGLADLDADGEVA